MFVRVRHEGTPVALVTIPADYQTSHEAALEYAWRWTNNVMGSWSIKKEYFEEDGMDNGDFNPNVEVLAPLHVHNGRTYGLRSSMVGDMFVVNDEDCYRVASCGFDKI